MRTITEILGTVASETALIIFAPWRMMPWRSTAVPIMKPGTSARKSSAVSEATVPKISVIVRKAYGAGLYAMAGPAFEPDCCIALPGASIAVMGPQAAVNAVFYNQIQAIEDEAEREAFVAAKREEYAADIDLLHLASELIIDAVVEPADLRDELVRRFAVTAGKDRSFAERRNPVTPA